MRWASLLMLPIRSRHKLRNPASHPSRREALGLIAAGAAALAAPSVPALAQVEKVRYLFPAPASLVAFAPCQIALNKGYYRQENVDVDFTTVNGGAEVAKQVGVNNADLGGGIVETPIIVRANGVPIREVALLGGHSLHKIAWRNDRGVSSPRDLKGKTVTVLSYTDTSYYTLLGILGRVGLTKNDVNIQAVGPTAITQLVIAGKADALCGPPEWVLEVQNAVPTTIIWNDRYFPSMAQAILSSDQTIARRPAAIRGVVRATLRAMGDIMRNPDQATNDYIAAVPQHRGDEATVRKVLTAYARYVYPGQKKLGAIDAVRLANVADFYTRELIVEKSVDVADLYTNQFV